MVRGSPLFRNPFPLDFALHVPSGTLVGIVAGAARFETRPREHDLLRMREGTEESGAGGEQQDKDGRE
jgi:hypothetical protein